MKNLFSISLLIVAMLGFNSFAQVGQPVGNGPEILSIKIFMITEQLNLLLMEHVFYRNKYRKCTFDHFIL